MASSSFYIANKANVTVRVILDKMGRHVATVRWLYPRDGAGSVRCEVYTPGEGITHRGRAGGYGYDKTTAALAGATIAGFRIADHCGAAEPEHEARKARFMRAYIRAAVRGMTHEDGLTWREKARRMGCSFANWSRSPDMPSEPGDKPGEIRHGYRWTSLHTMSGLERLSAAGFTVINAV